MSGRNLRAKIMLPEEGLPPGETRLSPEQVRTLTRSLAHKLAEDDRTLFAYIHGSFLRAIPSHDVDVAVYFREDMTTPEKLDACLSLGQTLSRDLGVPVDIHPIDPAHLPLSFDALSGRLLFDKDGRKRESFEERTIALYMDFAPMLREITRDLALATRSQSEATVPGGSTSRP